MDTPIMTQYYREHDPMKRQALLAKAAESGEELEANAVRRELWDIRYSESAEAGAGSRADGFLGLWMTMEFNRDADKRFRGEKTARKEIAKQLEKLKFTEIAKKSPLHQELLYKECCHLVRMYMELCQKDKSYNTTLCGIISISKDAAEKKMKRDIYETAVVLPSFVKMEEELKMIMDAAKEVYEEFFPGEGGLPCLT